MRSYDILRRLAIGLIWPVTGRIRYIDKDNLPDGNYILVGTHHTWWDPVWYAIAAYPKHFIFMAKVELFRFKPLGWLIRTAGAFPVDRQHVAPEVIKYPVNELRKGSRSLIMFPTGSRHATELKSGALVIAKLSRTPIVPAVYGGPLKFWQLFRRNNTTVAFGKPIYLDPKQKLTDDATDAYVHQIQAAFDDLTTKIANKKPQS